MVFHVSPTLMTRKIAREVNRQVALTADALSRDNDVSHNGHFDSVNRARRRMPKSRIPRGAKRNGNVRQRTPYDNSILRRCVVDV